MEEHAGGEKVFRIGRVCTKRAARGHGHTTRLMQAALAEVGDHPCRINAQTYLADMYAQHGFVVDGDEFSRTASRTCRCCRPGSDGRSRRDAPPRYPFSAIVGHDRLRLALVLCAVRPEIGGVLIRGEKGTAKSTAVRALAAVLAEVDAGLATGRAADRRHRGPGGRLAGSAEGAARRRARVLARACWPAPTAACSTSTRSTCCTTTSSTCCSTPPRWAGCTSSATACRTRHDARFVLVGTMNPEEGELRPQLLDRFGLTVDVHASRDVDVRVEVIRRRLAYEADPARFAAALRRRRTRDLAARIAAARARVGEVTLPDAELRRIAALCAAFDVDGMRADLVLARTAVAHAAWRGADTVAEEDIRVAAELALPHRRRRDPFDDPGLDPAPARRGAGRRPPTAVPEPGARTRPARRRPGRPTVTRRQASAPQQEFVVDRRTRPAARRRRPTLPDPGARPCPASARAPRAGGPGPATASGARHRARPTIPSAGHGLHLFATVLAAAGVSAAGPRRGCARRPPPRGARRPGGQPGDLRRRRLRVDGGARPDVARSAARRCRCCATPISAATRSRSITFRGDDAAAAAAADLVGAHRRAAAGPLRHRRHARRWPRGCWPPATWCVRERVRDRARRRAGGGAHRRPRHRRPGPAGPQPRRRRPAGRRGCGRGGGGLRDRPTSGWAWPASWPRSSSARCCGSSSCAPTIWRRPCAAPPEPSSRKEIADAAGTAARRARRRADHPAAPQRAAARGAHRRRARASRPPRSAWRCAPGTRAERRRCSSSSRAPSGRSARSRRSRALGRLHDEHGDGGPVEWHKMGVGLVLVPQGRAPTTTTPRPPPRAGPRSPAGSAEQRHDFYVLDEFTYPLKWGWVDVDDVVDDAARPARAASTSSSPAATPRSSCSRPPTWSPR